LAILRTLAQRLNHPAQFALERPFVRYVANQPYKAQEHFHGLQEAKPDMVGIAIYDRLERELPVDPTLKQMMWSRRELENYLCQRETLLAYAEAEGRKQEEAPSLAQRWRQFMEEAIQEVEQALKTEGKNPREADIKVSDEFLAPLFRRFYEKLGLPNMMSKTNYHVLAQFVPVRAIDPEIHQALDAIWKTAHEANPRRD